MTKIEWIAMSHSQNLNGRETEDELFELGIKCALEEVEEWIDKRIEELIKAKIKFQENGCDDWIEIPDYKISDFT